MSATDATLLPLRNAEAVLGGICEALTYIFKHAVLILPTSNLGSQCFPGRDWQNLGSLQRKANSPWSVNLKAYAARQWPLDVELAMQGTRWLQLVA